MPCKSCKSNSSDAAKRARMNQLSMSQAPVNMKSGKMQNISHDYGSSLYRQGAGTPVRATVPQNANAAFNAKMASIYRSH